MLGAALKSMELRSCALIVIDVQNDFCAAGGYYDRTGADLTAIEPAVNRLLQLIDCARLAGVMVIFVRSQYDPIYLSATQTARRRRVGWDIPLCQVGTPGFDFYRVQPAAGEPIVTKHRFDAFYGTDLELLLTGNHKRHLFFAGVATNVCVESSLRSAFMRDFEVVIVEDCAAARTTRAHGAALDNVRQHFGLVASAADVERAWMPGSAAVRSPQQIATSGSGR
jgi:ureidoacrylate peracid hydrolase